MKGNGNGLSTLMQKLIFALLPTAKQRSRYIQRHRKLFHKLGNHIQWQPRKFPSDPELLSIGNNVRLASGVVFINHDAISTLLNDSGLYDNKFKPMSGPIEIGNNVLFGANVIVLPNVKIGNQVIIAAGAIVTKDIPDNSLVAGIPAKVIGKFEDVVKRRGEMRVSAEDGTDALWKDFYERKGKK